MKKKLTAKQEVKEESIADDNEKLLEKEAFGVAENDEKEEL